MVNRASWREQSMQLPVQITFQHMDPSPALEARIRKLAVRLEKFSTRIVRCRIIVEPPAQRKHRAGLYDVQIEITLPDTQLVIHRTHPADQAHESPYVTVRDTFRAIRRKLEDYEHRRRHNVKTHAGQAHGRI